MSYDYRAIQYIQESLTEDEKAVFLWDGRGYYCGSRCVPDDEQSAAINLSFDRPSPRELSARLGREGVTHLILSRVDATWFIIYHDPHRWHRDALDYFEHSFFPECGKLVYSDDSVKLFEIVCR
jgi:hypothetical protein